MSEGARQHFGVIRVRARYVGRVQGIGFRATARAAARTLPLSGWVRNEDDGSVVLEVQGEGAAVTGFLASLSQTLGRFIVNEVRTPVPCTDGEVGFLIRN